MKIIIVAECGINHNGSLRMAEALICQAKRSGCDYVKFQKRTPECCVPEHMRDTMRDTPWGRITYMEYRERIEFGKAEYAQIDEICRREGIDWFASAWDVPSAVFLYDMHHDHIKIPSARLTDDVLLAYCRANFGTLILSTGMSTEAEIEHAVSLARPEWLLHTHAVYPAKCEELNLSYIQWLHQKYPELKVGYSGHEYGLVTSFSACGLGARMIERHITLDRTQWGSDQAASVEPCGLDKLVRGIRDIEIAIGSGGPRKVTVSEQTKRQQLRGS
ncbi:hypothetical protein LCGC14_0657460 [marine sediment metagenome]|uniref:PseI/NeuA/B-like domain-containing protein n=1 Tax=marine sediment metagenome TaxID=412755 RepID=A0A0F9U2Y5_9ZZZZ